MSETLCTRMSTQKHSVFTERYRKRERERGTDRVHMTAGLNVLAARRDHVMTTAL